MGSHLPCGLEDTGVEDSQIGSIGFCILYFVFKIRQIRLGFSFQKNKNFCIWPHLYLNSQPTDFQPGVLTTTPQSQLWVGDTEKNFQ